MDIQNVVDYILATCSEVTPLKLQKLVYYVKVWSLVARRPLVDAPFEKWMLGPVNPTLYHTYKPYGKSPIPAPDNKPKLQAEDQQLIDLVLSAYAHKSAFALSALTHNEPPWIHTADKAEISEAAILDYYSQQPFAKNFQNGGNGPFYLLQDDNWHAFTLDMSPEDALRMASVSSYAEYQTLQEQVRKEVGSFFEELYARRS